MVVIERLGRCLIMIDGDGLRLRWQHLTAAAPLADFCRNRRWSVCRSPRIGGARKSDHEVPRLSFRTYGCRGEMPCSLCSLPRLNAVGCPARFQTLQEIQKPDRLPRAIPLGLGERLEHTTVRELPNSLMDRGLGSPCHGSGNG